MIMGLLFEYILNFILFPSIKHKIVVVNIIDIFNFSEFDLRRFLCTESEQLIWKSEGLPSDDLSIENALVILQVGNYLIFSLEMFLLMLAPGSTSFYKFLGIPSLSFLSYLKVKIFC